MSAAPTSARKVGYTLEGVNLLDAAGRWYVAYSTSYPALPQANAINVEIAGRHGVLPIPAATFTKGREVIDLVVTDRDGSGISMKSPQLETNLQRLYGLLGARGRYLSLVKYLDRDVASSARQADVEVTAEVTPQSAGDTEVLLQIPFDLPRTFWRDTKAKTIQSEVATTWEDTPSALAGGAGPIVDARVLAAGPLSSIRIEDAASGSWMSWKGTLAAGQWVRLEAGTWSAWRTGSQTWSGGTKVTGGLDASVSGLVLTPDPVTMTPTFAVTRGGGSGVVIVEARRAYL